MKASLGKWISSIAILGGAFTAHAHCPYQLNYNGTDYCVNVSWDRGEVKDKGTLKPSSQISPALNLMGEIPKKWIYSKAYVSLWAKADTEHSPVQIENLNIFPFMIMSNGHHHPAGGSQFYFDESANGYMLRQANFQQMNGCWSLRWTTDRDEESMSTSELLGVVTDYTNLSPDQIKQQQEYCKSTEEAIGRHHQH